MFNVVVIDTSCSKTFILYWVIDMYQCNVNIIRLIMKQTSPNKIKWHSYILLANMKDLKQYERMWEYVDMRILVLIWDRHNLFEGRSPIMFRGRNEKGMYYFFQVIFKVFFKFFIWLDCTTTNSDIYLWLQGAPSQRRNLLTTTTTKWLFRSFNLRALPPRIS